MSKQCREEDINLSRDLTVMKSDKFIQKARFGLSLEEQQIVLYVISKIKPTDNYFCAYEFDIKDFYALCGVKNDSYTYIKKIVRGLTDKSWWATIDDHGTESVLRWFTIARTNKSTGKVVVKFHEDMFPALMELRKQFDELGEYYTRYRLKSILAFKSQYSIRLYELLKSYEKNNVEWYFEFEKLKKQLMCESYDWYNFKKRVLETALKEINKYTELNIDYDTSKDGKKITKINFFFKRKNKDENLEAEKAINEVLDGQIDIDELIATFMKKKAARENGNG